MRLGAISGWRDGGKGRTFEPLARMKIAYSTIVNADNASQFCERHLWRCCNVRRSELPAAPPKVVSGRVGLDRIFEPVFP